MIKERGKTTTTNTYSIPTSFVGTAYQWIHVGMEYDVFVFMICTHHPYITLNFEEMFFLLVPLIVLCTHTIQ